MIDSVTAQTKMELKSSEKQATPSCYKRKATEWSQS